MGPKLISTMLTLENHLSVSYGPMKSFSYLKNEPWNFRHGSCTRKAFDWRTECALNIFQAHQSLGTTKLAVYYDGTPGALGLGLLLHLNKIPFQFFAPRLENDQNLASLTPLMQFCHFHKMKLSMIDVDSRIFLNSEVTMKRALDFRTDQLSQLLAMEVWSKPELKEVFLICPFGLPNMEKSQHGWKIVEHEKDYALMRFQGLSGGLGMANFFKWGPELMSSFLTDPQVQSVFLNGADGEKICKNHYFQFMKSYFSMPDFQVTTGFENSPEAKTFQEKLSAQLEDKFKAYVFNYQDYVEALEQKPGRLKAV